MKERGFHLSRLGGNSAFVSAASAESSSWTRRALTPVAVLMFRINNPDAMLVPLLVAASGAARCAPWRTPSATPAGLCAG